MKLKITTDAFLSIVKKIASNTVEKGGILMGRKDGVISDFIFDQFATSSGTSYTLNVDYLNPIISEFKHFDKELLGIVHSHPLNCSSLSEPDKIYFLKLLKNAKDVEYLFTPIVYSAKEGEFEFFPYVFHKNGDIELAELEILPNDYEQYLERPQEPTTESETPKQESGVVINQTVTVHIAEAQKLNIGELLFFTALLTGFFTMGMLATLLFIIKIA